MAKRMKFNPIISKIKLNPEQAVLNCSCYRGRYRSTAANSRSNQCTARYDRTLSRSCTSANTGNTT